MYEISGYIVGFERNSKELTVNNSKIYEQVQTGAFKRTIESSNNIALVLNHNDDNVLARTGAGTLKLWEDYIGLAFKAKLNDPSIAVSIEMGDICGCSFKFSTRRERVKEYHKGLPIRLLEEVDLIHVSLIKNLLSQHM